MNKTKECDLLHIAKLRDLFTEYLSQRMFDPLPHLTFKRFLVAKNQRTLCDLLDDINKGKVRIPSWHPGLALSYAFKTQLENLPGHKGKIIQEICR